MASTGEPDRKRRHFSSISPTAAAAAAKKQTFWVSSEEKFDTAVLQFQNQKLAQKLEAQKVELSALENKFSQVKERQQPYDSTLKVVQKAWETLVNDLESCSIRIRESSSGQRSKHIKNNEDCAPSSPEDVFLSRLIQTGATESSSSTCATQVEEDNEPAKTDNIICNVMAAIDDLWWQKCALYDAVLKKVSEDGTGRLKASMELESEVKNLRTQLNDIHLKHKSLSTELQRHRDSDAKNKAELKRVREELEVAVAELEESNCNLAALRAERDATKGTFFPVLNFGNTNVAGDKFKDKQRDLQDMESVLKELRDQASSRLQELKGLHEERIKILEQLSSFQNTLKSVKCISSSQAYSMVRDQLEKSKTDVFHYQALLEKLQVEKDTIFWSEKELSLKSEFVDVSRRSSAVADSRVAYLESEIKRKLEERKKIQATLDDSSRDQGRKEIIAEFRALLSSFPEEMRSMQAQLNRYKEAAVDIHSLRADVQSLSSILDRKAKKCKTLALKSADQMSQIHKLRTAAQELKNSDSELKLILDMYSRESTNTREVAEAKDLEYKAWAHVRCLKSSLDEQNLEIRVKLANKAEALSQQRLAAAETEIADLRQKLEVSKREMAKLSDVLRSKNEENETYLSEIETIGQAYDDIQTQNRHLLQQITDRDDYNIKLALENVRARQLQDALLMDKRIMEKDIQDASSSADYFSMKASRIEDQLLFCLDHAQNLAEDRYQKSVTMESMQKRLSDLRRASDQARESLAESQSRVEKNRLAYGGLQLELEKERFSRRRVEEELEIVRGRVSRLRQQIEGSSVIEKLRQELCEYKEILKCSACLERPKEVVITKCYHLLCNQCVQKVVETPRHRRCPRCSASFGPNDVKPVYI